MASEARNMLIITQRVKDTLYTASMTNKKMTKTDNNAMHIPESMLHNLRSGTNGHETWLQVSRINCLASITVLSE